MKIDELIAERNSILKKMDDEIQFVKLPYLPKLKALEFQIDRLTPGKKKSDVAKNVRKYKS